MNRHLVSTRVHRQPCPRCRRTILTAWAEGLRATVDTKTLSRREEAAAILGSRRTYTRLHCGELVYRDASRIKGGRLEGPIHAEHKCELEKQGELF